MSDRSGCLAPCLSARFLFLVMLLSLSLVLFLPCSGLTVTRSSMLGCSPMQSEGTRASASPMDTCMAAMARWAQPLTKY